MSDWLRERDWQPLVEDFHGSTPAEVLRAAADWIEREGHSWVVAADWNELEWAGHGGSDPGLTLVVMRRAVTIGDAGADDSTSGEVGQSLGVSDQDTTPRR